MLAFLHIACHGLAGAGCSGPEFGPGGESDHVHALKTGLCVNTIKSNEGVIVGVKVRLDKNITDGGRNEGEVLKCALTAARVGSVPLTDHHSGNVKGAAKDLPWVMTKFYHLGK